MKTCIYLRKSRADEEAEKQGEFETLHRHKTTLLKIAKEKCLNIVDIKEELESGESIKDRPKMIELLTEVEQNKYDAVLVMDIDRLGRGNMQDQGLILDTFKNSNTKIITPRKIYNLNNEFDEEYSEFEAFMARKELKLINRRLQRGRIKSIEEGKYISPVPPYGYKFKYDNNGKKYLAIDEHQADGVRLIFDMYLQMYGSSKIANKLNKLGYETNNHMQFKSKAVNDILTNITYCGYVKWKTVDIKNHNRTRPKDEQIIAKGNHEAIIDEITFNKAQEIRKNRSISPTFEKQEISNPLAGILICGKCGHKLVQHIDARKSKNDVKRFYIKCKHCDNKSSRFDYLEKAILFSLEDWLSKYKIKINLEDDKTEINKLKFELKAIERELNNTSNQQNRLHDLLERGIYSENIFLERYDILSNKINHLKEELTKINIQIKSIKETTFIKKRLIPTLQTTLENYYKSDNAKEKNILLKTVLDKVVYIKEKNQKNDDFIIELYPKLPK